MWQVDVCNGHANRRNFWWRGENDGADGVVTPDEFYYGIIVNIGCVALLPWWCESLGERYTRTYFIVTADEKGKLVVNDEWEYLSSPHEGYCTVETRGGK